jgi:ADP-heptose:LPS heptosyltransferase
MSSKIKNVRKIAVFRPGYLGELLCMVPAMRALRAAYPQAEISLVSHPWALFFIRRFSFCFDRFIHFPATAGASGKYVETEALQDFITEMRNEKFDLILQLADDGQLNNDLISQMGARYFAGYCKSGRHFGNPLLITYPDHLREVKRHLLLLDHLQIPLRGEQLEFPLHEEDRKDFENLLVPLTPGKYICVHPGARLAGDQWAPEHFAALADHCAEQGYTIVLTGNRDEADIAAEVTKCMRHPAIDLSGKTGLGALAYLVSHAFALISNCNGVSHLAAALRTRSIVINLNEEFERWVPANRSINTFIDGRQQLAFDQMFMAVVELTAPAMELA